MDRAVRAKLDDLSRETVVKYRFTKSMKNSVQEFFEEDSPLNGSPREILEALGKYGVRSLGYAGDMGCNPGYIFRGEAAFDYPLRSSLERSVRKKLEKSASIDGET